MSDANNPTESDDYADRYEGAAPSDLAPEDNANAQQSADSQPRACTLIDEKLDEFFAAFQQVFTDYEEDLAPREAFAKFMAEEKGVGFPDPDTGFGATSPGLGNHGIVTGGRGGNILTASDFAIDHNQGLITGGLDRLDGWYLNGLAARNPVARFADTENVGPEFQRQAPDDAHRFVQAQLEHYDDTDDGGSGNNAIDLGLRNLLEKPDFLAWALQALALGERSVVEVAAVLGGGTGTALSILVDEFARMGLIGRGDVAVGFSLGMQMGRVQNDVHLGEFDDSSPRYTYHDAHGATERVGQRIRDGDADWALWTENVPLTYNYWALQNNPEYTQLQDFYWALRQDTDPESVERMVNIDPRFSNLGHTERDRVSCLSRFAFRQLIRRPARAKFWVGEEDYDPADFRTDYHGYAFTPGFDAIDDFSELEDRNIPGVDGVNGHREALRGLGYTASAQLNSTVSFDEIKRANAVVHAAGFDVNGNDLQLVEESIQNALELDTDGDGRDKPVRAVLMDGLGTDHHPGDYQMAVSVYAGHDLALDAHDRMATSEYKRAVTGGDD